MMEDEFINYVRKHIRYIDGEPHYVFTLKGMEDLLDKLKESIVIKLNEI